MPGKNVCSRIADPAARRRCENYQGEFSQAGPAAGSKPAQGPQAGRPGSRPGIGRPGMGGPRRRPTRGGGRGFGGGGFGGRGGY